MIFMIILYIFANDDNMLKFESKLSNVLLYQVITKFHANYAFIILHESLHGGLMVDARG